MINTIYVWFSKVFHKSAYMLYWKEVWRANNIKGSNKTGWMQWKLAETPGDATQENSRQMLPNDNENS